MYFPGAFCLDAGHYDGQVDSFLLPSSGTVPVLCHLDIFFREDD